MAVEIQAALVGVIGTLAGTLLGWFLNSLSQKGKLNIDVILWNEKFEYNKIGYMTLSTSKEQAECFSYNLKLDMYNASGKTKIMRKIKIEFWDSRKILFEDIPKDETTRRNCGAMVYRDDVSVINIPAKTVVCVNFVGGLWKEKSQIESKFSSLWKTEKIYLAYTDEKNKRRKKIIKKERYEDYYNNHQIEQE